MIIYLDLLFLKEILFNSIIIFLTGKIIDQNPKKIKKILGNIAGSIYTTILIVLNYKECDSSLVHLSCGMLIVLITFKNTNLYEILKNTLILYVVTYAIGGIYIYAQTQEKNLYLYLIALLLFIPSIIKKYKVKYKLNSYYGKTTLLINKKKETLSTFIDTGHELTSTYGEPVIILSKKYKSNNQLSYDRTIKFKTINEENISVNGTKQKGIILEYEKNKYENDAVVIISKNNFEKYDAIIGLDFFTDARKIYEKEKENKKDGNIIFNKK